MCRGCNRSKEIIISDKRGEEKGEKKGAIQGREAWAMSSAANLTQCFIQFDLLTSSKHSAKGVHHVPVSPPCSCSASVHGIALSL